MRVVSYFKVGHGHGWLQMRWPRLGLETTGEGKDRDSWGESLLEKRRPVPDPRRGWGASWSAPAQARLSSGAVTGLWHQGSVGWGSREGRTPRGPVGFEGQTASMECDGKPFRFWATSELTQEWAGSPGVKVEGHGRLSEGNGVEGCHQ